MNARRFTSRFENGTGTNTEELLSAAYASCFGMTSSLILGKAILKLDYVHAIAHVTVSPQDGVDRRCTFAAVHSTYIAGPM
jgi:organic hydroperoxide reductase OsmC/OhrA